MANKLQVANIATKEVVEISNGVFRNGVAYYLSKSEPKAKWCEKYHVRIIGHEEAGAYTKYLLDTEDDWSFVVPVKEVGEKKERKPRAPKPEPAPEPKEETPAPVMEEVIDIPEQVEVKPEPAPAPKKEDVHAQQPASKTETSEDFQMAMQIMAMLKGSKGAIDVAQVEAIAKRVAIEVIGDSKPQEVVHKIQVADMPEYVMPEGEEVDELFEELMWQVANDRVIGRFPWLYGPAGSGKSTMAQKVADAMGLPFYSVSSLQQKYELEGYSDAVGEFVQTAFYKAMAEGGIFCFDEMSTTSGEVQVAFNTAAAQLLYNFPKVGMVKAHENFHIIACDNSTGRGGDKKYISRFQLDASTLDRYTFIEVGYTDKHDLRMANGDKDLVKFMKDIRKVLEDANTTYLATPRASKSIKVMQQRHTDDKALWYGLCSGWKAQDIRTFAARLSGSTRYHLAFQKIADNI